MNNIHKRKIRALTLLGLCISFIIIIIISFASWDFNVDFIKNSISNTHDALNKNTPDVAKTFMQLLVSSIIESFFIFIVIHNIQTKIPFLITKVKTRYFIQSIAFLLISLPLMGLHNKYFNSYMNLYQIVKINSTLDQKASLYLTLFFLIPTIILIMFASHIYEQTEKNFTSIIIIITTFNVLLWMFVGFTTSDSITSVLTVDVLDRIKNLISSIPIK